MYKGASQVQMRRVRKEGSGDGVRDVRGQILRGVSGNLPPEGARGLQGLTCYFCVVSI